jgi:hypothetical protein
LRIDQPLILPCRHRHQSHSSGTNIGVCRPPSKMTSNVSIEVLQMILENVDKANLVNKIVCSCTLDIIYRDIHVHSDCLYRSQIYQKLARSTHLARRICWFAVALLDMFFRISLETLSKTLVNIYSLHGYHSLHFHGYYSSILDGRTTFKLDSFSCNFGYDESLLKAFKPSTRSSIR